MKTIHYFFLIVMALLLTQTATAQKQKLNTLGDFDRINISGSIDVYLTMNDINTVILEGSDSQMEAINVEVRNGELYISQNSGTWKWLTISNKIKVYISATTLNAIRVSGGSSIHSKNTISSDQLNIATSGASDAILQVDVEELALNSSGGSDIKISGRANTVSIKASGGSDIFGKKLITNTASVKASGGSDISITVNDTLSAKATGGSDIRYSGAAKNVSVTNTGGSDIIRL